MGKGLLQKAGRIQLPPVRTSTDAGTPVDTPVQPGVSAVVNPAAKPRTAPGTLMGFMATQSEAIKENEKLRDQLRDFDGARPARLIDPRLIRPSAWANRHESSFARQEFAELKAEIAQAGGNVQAIKVRPIARSQAHTGEGVGPSYPPESNPAGEGVGPSYSPGSDTSGEGGRTVPSPAPQYEIAFGHRRHRACLELGLPVLAVVEDIGEQELFVQMERENRNRADLSVWEQGVMYARALDAGLYPSNRQLAAAIGRDVSDIGKALAVARLPMAVIEAFGSPLDLQFRWAKPLSDAQQKDPDLLLNRAKSLRDAKLSPKDIFAALVAETTQKASPRVVNVERDGVVAATVTKSVGGMVSIKLHKAMDDGRMDKLVKALEKLL